MRAGSLFLLPICQLVCGDGGAWFGRGGWGIGDLSLPDEAVALPGDGLDISRAIGRVPQSAPQSPYRGVDTKIEFDYGLVRPEALANLLARNNFARGFEQHLEDLEGLLLEPNSATLFAQFAFSEVQLEWAEAHV
jgi:hypothetical protein